MGKDLVAQGLESGDFYRKDDSSVWVDLTEQGLDEKILLRSDGTSVYMTQDLGTAQNRYDDTGATKMIYVVADEQDYHFKVLFEIMKKLKAPFADGLYHLSYGMVDLPSGRMKSREGTVVDADDLIAEVIGAVKSAAQERGELVDLTEEERSEIYRKIGLAALKFFILKVNPKKRMIFNPEESVDMQGQTGPYIQNAYVRIQSIKRRIAGEVTADSTQYTKLDPTEIEIIKMLIDYEQQIEQAAAEYDPSGIATYSYELAKRFHKFYHDVRVIKAESAEAKSFRLVLSDMVSRVLGHSMDLLGIEMPERM
jgi:arginyl-tRNA synthetase